MRCRRLWHNGPLWNALGSGLYAAVTFILLFFVSRYCGPESAGVFSMAFTTGQLLYLAGLFGADAFHMTDYRQEYALRAYAKLRLITCAAMLLCCLPLAGLVYTGEKGQLTFVLTLYMLLNAAAELWQSEYFRQNRLDLSGQALLLRNGCAVLAFCVALRYGRSMVIAAVCATAANLLATVAVGPLRFRRISGGEQTGREEFGGLPKACLPLFISTFLMTLLPSCPKYEMDLLTTDELVGYFSMIVMPLQFINLFAGFVFRPSFKRLSDALEAGDSKRFFDILRRNTLIIALMTVACVALAALAGVQVLGWLYHADLAAYRLELVWVVVSGGLLAFSSYMFYTLVVMRRQGFACALYAGATLLCAGLGVPLIARMGMMGGVLSFLVAYCALCVVELSGLNRIAREVFHG